MHYQIDDHLGSASLELNENAAITSCEEYHLPEDEASAKSSIGSTSYQKHNTDISQKRYKYVGKERDDETGLYYYGVRHYAAWIGRWTAVDPMANRRVTFNPYNYCQNNPINRTDPTGALDDGIQGGGSKKFPNLLVNGHTKELAEAKANLKNAQNDLINASKLAHKEISSIEISDDENISKIIKRISKKYKFKQLTNDLHDTMDDLNKTKNSFDLVNEEIAKLEKYEDKLVYDEDLLKSVPSIKKLFAVKLGDKIEMLKTLDSMGVEITMRHDPSSNVKNHVGKTIEYYNSQKGSKKHEVTFEKQDAASIFNEIGDIFFEYRYSNLASEDDELKKKALKEAPNEQEAYSRVYNKLKGEKFSKSVDWQATKLMKSETKTK